MSEIEIYLKTNNKLIYLKSMERIFQNMCTLIKKTNGTNVVVYLENYILPRLVETCYAMQRNI